MIITFHFHKSISVGGNALSFVPIRDGSHRTAHANSPRTILRNPPYNKPRNGPKHRLGLLLSICDPARDPSPSPPTTGLSLPRRRLRPHRRSPTRRRRSRWSRGGGGGGGGDGELFVAGGERVPARQLHVRHQGAQDGEGHLRRRPPRPHEGQVSAPLRRRRGSLRLGPSPKP